MKVGAWSGRAGTLSPGQERLKPSALVTEVEARAGNFGPALERARRMSTLVRDMREARTGSREGWIAVRWEVIG